MSNYDDSNTVISSHLIGLIGCHADIERALVAMEVAVVVAATV